MSERKVYGSQALKERSTQKRSESLRIRNFQEKHPLASLHRAFHMLQWRKEEGDWERADVWADKLIRGFANLSTELRQQTSEAFPGHPDPVQATNSAWCLYLGTLLASRSRREAIAQFLDKMIADGWGVEYIPNTYRVDQV